MTYLELLIYLLKTLNNDESLHTLSDSEFQSNPLVSAVKYLADICLIDNEGNPNNININEVSKNGFPVYAGEKDRFGWLTGCIDIHDRTILFG